MTGKTKKAIKPAALLLAILTMVSVMAIPASASTLDGNSQSRRTCKLIGVTCAPPNTCGFLWSYRQEIYTYRCDDGNVITESPFNYCC